MDTANPLPAPQTKHHPSLPHPLPRPSTGATLIQRAGNAGEGTTGTTLWTGAQVLAAYLCSSRGGILPDRPAKPTTALELGAGVGLLALALAQAGVSVVTTDIEPVLGLLKRNVDLNVPEIAKAVKAGGGEAGSVRVAELDWVAVADEDKGESYLASLELPAIDMIVTADTVYAPHLTPALWSTLRAVSVASARASGSSPTIYLALERRDPGLTDAAFAAGKEAGCDLRRVAHGRVAKAVERCWGWKGDEWEGCEVWKGRFKV